MAWLAMKALAVFAVFGVFGIAVTAVLLALAHRSWQLTGNVRVEDDLEARRIALLAAAAGLDDEGLEVAAAAADPSIAPGPIAEAQA